MGRQVNVELKELTKVGCSIIFVKGEKVTDDMTGHEYTTDGITVVLPTGGSVYSSYTDMLVFDCRGESSRNYYIEQWFIANNVPYIAG